jgi:hypothetical protein
MGPLRRDVIAELILEEWVHVKSSDSLGQIRLVITACDSEQVVIMRDGRGQHGPDHVLHNSDRRGAGLKVGVRQKLLGREQPSQIWFRCAKTASK